MPGSPAHLAARFFDVLRADPLRPDEEAEVASWLEPPELDLFRAQPAIDQRHGHDAGRFVSSSSDPDPVLIRAALLHDVGKRHARLGVVGRVLASLAIMFHLPLRGRFRAYRDHGPVAATELAAAGSPEPVVEFARNHHGPRPPGFEAAAWEILIASDRPSKDRRAGGSRIT